MTKVLSVTVRIIHRQIRMNLHRIVQSLWGICLAEETGRVFFTSDISFLKKVSLALSTLQFCPTNMKIQF